MQENPLRKFAPLTGRVFLSLIFLISAFGKIADFPGTAEFMASEGMRAAAFFLVGAIVFEIAGGLSVVLGFYARIGALLLIGFLVPTTLIFHDFWMFEGAQQQEQMIHFLKNLAIMGGLLQLVAHGSGQFSLDSKFPTVDFQKLEHE